jgi:uncharacterized repeat protein (TIGR03847 family)
VSTSHDFDHVDAFAVGAVGRPGQRVFLLQARLGRTRVTVKCEKQQAAALADYLRRVLHDLPPPDDAPVPEAAVLADPLEADFVLGSIGLGYDRESDRVLVQLDEIVLDDDSDDELDDADEPDDERSRLRVQLTRGQVVSFCEQADVIVSAGRPPCRWCALPIDPSGHVCPRMN